MAEHAEVVTHYLEMTDPGSLVRSAWPPPAGALRRLDAADPALQRRLYTSVGSRWHWVDRLVWSDADWVDWFNRPGGETWIISQDDAPVGYFDLAPDGAGDVEIAYFGLVPSQIGRGLGGPLLTAAVERAWAIGARRVWLHTCSLDHPHALPGYLARGFRVFRTTRRPP